jgi:leader peptidase (prepilin peptidase)/N-methyltransferase
MNNPGRRVLEQLEPLTTTPLAYGFAIVLGLVWGSFANVCIYRWPPTPEFPAGRSVVRPGSHCFACKAEIPWYDNLPLVAWLWLRGKCRSCKAPFSARYLIVEAVTAALFGVAWWATVTAGALFEPLDVRLLRFVIYAAFCFVMVVVTFIDLDHKLILDKLTRPAVVAFYLLGLALPERMWWEGLVGAAVGYGVPWAIGEIYYRVTGREGLGLGDSMLLAVIGALLGWQGVVVALFGGSVLGSVIGITALAVKRRDAADDEGDAESDAEGEPPRERAAGAPPATGSDAPASTETDAAAGSIDDASLMRTELPFGPFLAMAAVFYLFAEPWMQLHFALLGG